MAALQWHKLAYGSEGKDPMAKGLAFEGLKRRHIRSAWFAVDKSAELNRNIAMAFKLLNNDIPPPIMKVYMSLMRHYEQFHIRSMSVTWKNRDSWRDWWIEAVQVIPGLLRIFLFVDDQNRLEVAKTALRIIAQILPDDWMSDALREQGPIAPLRYITPQDPEYGQAAISLIATFLDASTLHDCRTTRDAAAEVLGWMMTLYQPQALITLPPLITDANGMYQRSTSIPSFLLSVLTDKGAAERLRHFLQPQFDFLLNLPKRENESISEVQLETLILSLTHLHEFLDPPGLATQLREFWNRTVDNMTEDIWPQSFVYLGVVKTYQQPGSGRPVMKLCEDEKMLMENDLIRLLWTGSAIALAWRIFVHSAENPERLRVLVFSHDALATVLACCEAAQSNSVALLFTLFEEYLDTAHSLAVIPVSLREKLDSTITFLKSLYANEGEAWA
ncbi:hypothetical protein FRC02_004970 [Tulasnella sp. 418]|nr:hypothetical protein FRC02_004970 [Tulasnella sp. 418]